MLAAGCSEDLYDPNNHDKIDPNLSLNRDDYKNVLNPDAYKNPNVPGEMLNPSEPPIPALEDVLAAPSPPKIGATKLVSVAVTDDVPLKDVLIELARLADVDIEVDAGITGGVAFRAKDKPFNEVVERIADLAGLRYTMKNGVLRVERDTPYVQTYNIDFLNVDRESSSNTSISTNVFTGGVSSDSGDSGGGSGGSGAGGVNSGSSSSVTSESKSDFWTKFNDGMTAIMAYVPPSRVSTVTVASQPTPATGEAGQAGAPAAPAAATPAPAAAAAEPAASFFIMNRQAGALTVSGTSKQHDLVQKFLEKIRATTSAQVLIEAKILEVTLNDQFQSGIDWTRFGNNSFGMPMTFGAVTDAGNAASFAFSLTGIAGRNFDLQAAVDLTQIFGTTRTLSSPRLNAINNQQAVLTFAENIVYFELDVSSDTTTAVSTSTSVTVEPTIKTVPIGIIMTLLPSINIDTNEITLSVRPTLSRVTGSVDDPTIPITLAQLDAAIVADLPPISNKIPIVEVRELDSILKLRSGEVMVIGGLMEDKSINTDKGVPWISEVPYIGNAFKGVDKDHDIKELVIFIKATIVGPHGNAHPMDKAVYEKFTKDPRPLEF